MSCFFALLVKPPICHSIDQAGQDKKSKNFNSSISFSWYGLKNRPKPIKTSISTKQEKFHKHQHPKDLNFYDSSPAKEKPKHGEDGFKKTKSRGMKIYRELKKVKQPPLSSFLNSLFTNGKKANISSNDDEDRILKSTCLRKNIISTPCGHKNLDMDQLQNVEAIKNINKNHIHELKFYKNIIEMIEEDEDEGASCASSDLFELDIFSPIGSMELSVYETTNLGIN
ncbi:protein BIG GRAIN 1-like A [Solanum pennellii]|uniref:Protein BIG GRAIN 1-like A n=1 Tax=Solanum pennellii TaxID=28526 RepID=A0ABM1FS31_SOLPN|nr:protein BIG GRAIN 1-like A [Solanum pennellii]